VNPFRTHVEFRSNAFPALPGEEEQINPGRWGKVLADYLRAELNSRQLPGGEPYAEDWGWAIPIDNDSFPLWVGCGNYEEYPDGFLCFIEPSQPFVRKFLRKVDTTARVAEVASALDAALGKHPEIHDLRWWTGKEAGTER
jgi:hypothetical protein